MKQIETSLNAFVLLGFEYDISANKLVPTKKLLIPYILFTLYLSSSIPLLIFETLAFFDVLLIFTLFSG